jgi:hypothetical protein
MYYTLSMRKNSKGFAQIFIIILFLVLAGGAVYYFGVKKGNIFLKHTLTSVSVATNIPNQVTNLLGFSFKYDDKEWNEKIEDLKYCNEKECGSSVGRVITLTNKKYTDPMKSIILTIGITNNYDSGYDSNKICFSPEDVQEIGQWYRARNPFSTTSDETRDRLWERWFYPKNVIGGIDGKKCLFGSVNSPKGSNIPVLYNGKQTWLSINLSNKFDPSMNNIADDIIKSINY